MEFEEFVNKYHSREIKVHVDKYKSKELHTTNILPKGNVYNDIIWGWIWMLSFPIGIALFIWVKQWIGVVVLIIGLMIPSALRETSSQNVLAYALENEEFYNFAIKYEIIIIEDA